jgi:hypothetical protein
MKPVKANASALHKDVYVCLCEMFPCFTVLQEVPIKIGKKTLFIDILVKELSLAFECHGRQHYEFVDFFHKDKGALDSQQSRDSQKKDWCEQHLITLIDVKYTEKVTKKMLKRKISKVL